MKQQKSPLRVAVVNPRYFPIIGGTENQARLLIAQLQRDARGQVEVPFFVTWRLTPDLLPFELVEGVPVRRLGVPGMTRWKHFHFYACAFFYLLLRRNRFDLIHCHGTSIVGFVMTLLGVLTRRPVICLLATNGEMTVGLQAHQHAGSALGRQITRLHGRFGRFTAAHAHVVALNSSGWEELMAAGARHPVRIPVGIDTEMFRPLPPGERDALRAEFGFGKDDVVLVFTGRFVARKGIDLLLDAAESLLANGKNPRLHVGFVGSGSLQPESVEARMHEAAERHPGQIHLLPPRIPVVPYLQIADAFVFPSRQEGLPQSVLEAFAVDLPCILSDIAPHRELQAHNPNARITLFRSGDAEALREALDGFLAGRGGSARPASPAQGNTATALDETFHIRKLAQRYLNLYREVAGSA